VMIVPSARTSRTTSLLLSAKKTSPCESTARPLGELRVAAVPGLIDCRQCEPH